MNRLELLGSPEYWLSNAALALYQVTLDYLKDNNLWWSDLENLGISKKTIKTLRNGDLLPGPDYYEVACKLGYRPVLELKENKEEP